MRCSVLGVGIDCITHHEVILQIAGFFRQAGQFHIATPNPEMLVEAQKNAKFRNVLQSTALNLPDGIGLVWAIKRKTKQNKTTNTPLSVPQYGERLGERDKQQTNIARITGTDTLLSLCSLDSRLCPPERIFLLGAAEGIAEKAAEELKRRNHMIKEIGTFAGSPKGEDEEKILRHINVFQPTLLFVAFGAPLQDLWIARNLKKMPTVKVAMGIGGALDFLAGKRKRAPQWMRKMGIEWLWRLTLEPSRFRRIWRAVVVFPWLVLTSPSPPPAIRG